MNSAMKFPILHHFLTAWTFLICLLLIPLPQMQQMTPLLQSPPMTASVLTSLMTSDSSLSSLDDVTLSSFQIPNILAEDSLLDCSLPHAAIATQTPPVEYCIIPNGSIHNNGSQLTALDTPKPKETKSNVWRCSIHNKTLQYDATVIQNGYNLTPGYNKHSCQAKQEIAKTLHIKKVKDTVLTNIFTFAEITEKIMDEDISMEPTPSLPAPSNLAKAANCHRQHIIPRILQPLTLSWQVTPQRASSAKMSPLVTDTTSFLQQTKCLNFSSTLRAGFLIQLSR